MMKSRLVLTLPMLLVVLGAGSATVDAQSASARSTSAAAGSGQANPDEAARAAEALVTKFYDITPLVVMKEQHPFAGDVFGSAPALRPSSSPLGGFGGGAFGGGVGGMSGGEQGGAGFFSVPSVSMQFGGMGEMGGMMGGMGGGGNGEYDGSTAARMFMTEYSADGILSLIKETIAPETWEDNGSEGTGRSLGNTLLITQTNAVHEQIAGFLKQLTEHVIGNRVFHAEIWWVRSVPDQRAALAEVLAMTDAEPGEVATRLTQISDSAGGFHATLLCRERVASHLTSGNRRPLVVSRTPVVATQATGEQPIVMHHNFGVTAELTPTVVPDYLSRSSDSGQLIDLNLRTSLTQAGAADQGAVDDSGIDRFDIAAEVLECSPRVRLGKATVLGSLTQVSTVANPLADAESGSTGEYAVIILITPEGASH